jgi:molybdenum cofactor cytidylyltransferase
MIKISTSKQNRNLRTITAIVLAAGQSRRMGEHNKLILPLDNQSMLERVVVSVLDSDIDDVVVVTGFESDKIQSAIQSYGVSMVFNQDYASGMASSLRCGLEALNETVDGAIIILADMPFINAELINQLISQYHDECELCHIVAPRYKGKRGNPVLWDKRYFNEMKNLSGDQGAKSLLKKYADDIAMVEVASDSIFIDVDTPKDNVLLTKSTSN